MKNILQILDYAAPYKGNFIPSMETLEAHWKPYGKMVFLIPDVAQSIAWVKNFSQKHKVYFISRKFYSKKISFVLIKQVIDIVKQEKIQVIHTHFIQANYNLLLAKLLMPDVRFVVNLHNHYIIQGRLWRLKKWVLKYTYHHVIGDSESVTESAWYIGVARNKTSTARNSIVFSRLDNYERQDFSEQGKYKWVVLMYGYPWYRKGVDVVVRALDVMNKTVPVKLMIAQAGREDDTKSAILKVLGHLPDWIGFLPPTDNLANYYQSVDVFISAGREEGLSYSPIEAAYCDCDVICSNIQGNPLDIPNIGIYDTENVEQLVEKIKTVFEKNKEKRREYKKIQRQYVLDAYDIDKWAEKIIKCYS